MTKQIEGAVFYKAWLGFAPIWVSDVYGECVVIPRFWPLGDLLLLISEACVQTIMLMDESYPGFPIRITDKDFKDD